LFVAWLYKRKNIWWLGWRVNGQIKFRSTKHKDRTEAEKELAKVRMLFDAHKAGTLDLVYEALSGKVLPKVTLKKAIEQWLTEVVGTTRDRYAHVAGQLAKYLGATDDRPLLTEVTTEQIREHLLARRRKCSVRTVNMERKILSVFFRRCIKNQQLRDNPVFPIAPVKSKDEPANKRRAFTLEELRLLYRKAPNDFWRYMIVGGTYTGLRMGDLISLAWPSVDFAEGMLRVKARKTSQTVQVPIAAAFRTELEALWQKAGKPKTGHVWPEQALAYQEKGSGPFSNEFYELVLTPCGFVQAREDKKAKASGRAAERNLNPISVHSCRHSFVSLLKATGGSQIVAKELAGHSSDLISDTYTTLPKETLVKAIEALPGLEDGK
jgi:integrase